MAAPIRYAPLRDRRTWPGCALRGLAPDVDGGLALQRVPGLVAAEAVDRPGPYDAERSGIAAGSGRVIVCDTSAAEILVHDTTCGSISVLPGHHGIAVGPGALLHPRGVAANERFVWVVDSGTGRLLRYRLPSLELINAAGGMAEPVGVGVDRHGRVTVLDIGAGAIRRFDDRLRPDADFDAATAAEIAVPGRLPNGLTKGHLAVQGDGTFYLSDEGLPRIIRFDPTGRWLAPLVGLSPTRRPGAIAIADGRIFVADVASGQILILDAGSGTELGIVGGFRAPVSGLAVASDGSLLIKIDDGPTWRACLPAMQVVDSGAVRAGPLDAGEEQSWFRIVVDADVPPGAAIELAVYQTDDATEIPTATDWQTSPALDTLLEDLVGLADPRRLRRFLHVRVVLRSGVNGRSPLLRQVRAETEGQSLLDHLPRTYRDTDDGSHILARLLALISASLERLEDPIGGLGEILGPQTTPTAMLPWLAEWVAIELPIAASPDEWRDLIPRAVDLHERRGSIDSLRQLVRLHTGVDIAIDEDFRYRHLWVLGEPDGSRLGFDTGLPAVTPAGMVVSAAPASPDANAPECAPEIGSVTVGELAPLPGADWGTVLYGDAAHVFSVQVDRADACVPGMLDALRTVLDRERPAHADYRLCVVDPTVRVGRQASIGVDAIVGRPPDAVPYGEAALGTSFRLDRTDGSIDASDQDRVGQMAVHASEGERR